MLDQFRIEARESNNDEIELLAEEGDIRITAKIPCALIDRLSATPPVTFNDRLDVMRRNLVVFAAIVQESSMPASFAPTTVLRVATGGLCWRNGI